MANLSARKQFDEGTIALLVPICHEPSPAIPVMTKPQRWGVCTVRRSLRQRNAERHSAADGYINTNLTANGSVGWRVKTSLPAGGPMATLG